MITEARMKIIILGEEWKIEERTMAEDKNLADCDGYCDKTVRLIVVCKKQDECTLADFEVYRKKVLRHEIIHAFLFESGLHESFTPHGGHDETTIDWIAAQYPKLKRAFKAAGCED